MNKCEDCNTVIHREDGLEYSVDLNTAYKPDRREIKVRRLEASDRKVEMMVLIEESW